MPSLEGQPPTALGRGGLPFQTKTKWHPLTGGDVCPPRVWLSHVEVSPGAAVPCWGPSRAKGGLLPCWRAHLLWAPAAHGDLCRQRQAGSSHVCVHADCEVSPSPLSGIFLGLCPPPASLDYQESPSLALELHGAAV